MSQISTSKVDSNSVTFISVLIGFFADIRCINAFLVAINPAFEGVMMSILYVLTIGFIVLYALIKRMPHAITPQNMLIIIYSLLLYFLTVLLGAQPRVSFLVFMVFSVVAYLIPLITTINVKLTLRSIMFFAAFSLLKLNAIFSFNYDYNEAISMGVSYAYLIPVLATIVYIYYYIKYDKGIQRVISYCLAFANFIFFMELFLFGSRGPLLAVLCCLALCYILTQTRNGLKLNNRRLFLFIIMTLIIITSFVLFINIVIEIMNSMGISSFALEKIARMIEADNLSNGRDELSRMAIDGFWESPLWGHGLDLFSYNYKVTSYPHNFILQILYDGGLLMFFLLIIPSLTRILELFKSRYTPRVIFFVFIFCASVPGAFFSGDLWELNMLWMFWGFLANKKFIFA